MNVRKALYWPAMRENPIELEIYGAVAADNLVITDRGKISPAFLFPLELREAICLQVERLSHVHSLTATWRAHNHVSLETFS